MDTIHNLTGYSQALVGEPLEYFGEYQGRTLASYFNKLVNKVKNRIDGWSSRLITMGGKLFSLGMYNTVYQFLLFLVMLSQF